MIVKSVYVIFVIVAFFSSSNAESNVKLSNIEQKINDTIVKIADSIGDIPVNEFNARSGLQEFGEFNLTTRIGTIYGFGDFVAEIITFQLFPIVGLKNLTLHFNNITFDFKEYDLNGYIDFPLGHQQFQLSGKGKLRASIQDLIISIYASLSATSQGYYVKELIMYADIGKIEISMENLLGGGAVGNAFQTVLNDVVITIFDYYKNTIIAAYNDVLKEAISDFINSILLPGNPDTT